MRLLEAVVGENVPKRQTLHIDHGDYAPRLRRGCEYGAPWVWKRWQSVVRDRWGSELRVLEDGHPSPKDDGRLREWGCAAHDSKMVFGNM